MYFYVLTSNPNMEPIRTSCHTPIGVIHLGLIGQFHYLALETVVDPNLRPIVSSNSIATPNDNGYSKENQHSLCDVSSSTLTQHYEKETIEDEEEFNHQTQLRGLPYDSCLQREDFQIMTDNIFSVAPQKPIAILTDEHFEEMCNPTKYTDSKFGLLTERDQKLTIRKYFNQRLLDADGRFAKDIEYLLTAQYAVESKQVADDASIMLRQTQGRLHREHALTASDVRNKEVMIQKDYAHRFLNIITDVLV